jgi:cell division septum initiation protein DivIVA
MSHTSRCMPIQPSQIQTHGLPRSFRGFDEAATDRLLGEAARALKQALSERDAFRRELERSRSEPLEHSGDAEAIGSALLTANRLGEQLLEEAREAARRVTAEAQERAQALLAQAEADAQLRMTALAGRAEVLRHQAQELDEALDDRRALIEAYIRLIGGQLTELDQVARVSKEELSNERDRLDLTLQTRLQETNAPPADARRA